MHAISLLAKKLFSKSFFVNRLFANRLHAISLLAKKLKIFKKKREKRKRWLKFSFNCSPDQVILHEGSKRLTLIKLQSDRSGIFKFANVGLNNILTIKKPKPNNITRIKLSYKVHNKFVKLILSKSLRVKASDRLFFLKKKRTKFFFFELKLASMLYKIHRRRFMLIYLRNKKKYNMFFKKLGFLAKLKRFTVSRTTTELKNKKFFIRKKINKNQELVTQKHLKHEKTSLQKNSKRKTII